MGSPARNLSSSEAAPVSYLRPVDSEVVAERKVNYGRLALAQAAAEREVYTAGKYPVAEIYTRHPEKVTGTSFLVRGKDEPLAIRRTKRNEHFMWTNNLLLSEVSYRNSADVVQFLEIMWEQAEYRKNGDPDREYCRDLKIAFFDKNGNFYDNATLTDRIVLRSQTGERQSHVAYFELPGPEGKQTLEMPVGDIYSIAPALPYEDPITWQSEGGDNN